MKELYKVYPKGNQPIKIFRTAESALSYLSKVKGKMVKVLRFEELLDNSIVEKEIYWKEER